nr:hypothetical protein [Parabacteroides goldsteinii]
MKNFIEVTTFEGVELINTAAIQRVYVKNKITLIELRDGSLETTMSYSDIIDSIKASEDR